MESLVVQRQIFDAICTKAVTWYACFDRPWSANVVSTDAALGERTDSTGSHDLVNDFVNVRTVKVIRKVLVEEVFGVMAMEFAVNRLDATFGYIGRENYPMVDFTHSGAGLAFHEDVVYDFEIFEFVGIDFFDHVADHGTATL